MSKRKNFSFKLVLITGLAMVGLVTGLTIAGSTVSDNNNRHHGLANSNHDQLEPPLVYQAAAPTCPDSHPIPSPTLPDRCYKLVGSPTVATCSAGTLVIDVILGHTVRYCEIKTPATYVIEFNLYHCPTGTTLVDTNMCLTRQDPTYECSAGLTKIGSECREYVDKDQCPSGQVLQGNNCVSSLSQQGPPKLNGLTDFNAPNYGLVDTFSHGGNESDFVRLGATGQLGDSVEACNDGQIVKVWTYIHNGRSASLNGDQLQGSVVSRGTKFKLDVIEDSARSHSVKATISSTNATSAIDTATITCSTNDISVVYDNNLVVSQGVSTSSSLSSYGVSGDPTQSGGIDVGFSGGVLPACRDYMLRVVTQVRIEVEEDEVEPPEITADADYNCDDGLTGSVTIDGISSASNPDPVEVQIVGTVRGSSQSQTISLTPSRDSSDHDTYNFDLDYYHSSWKTTQPVDIKVRVNHYDADYDHTGFEDVVSDTLPAWDADNDGRWDCLPDIPPDPDLEILGSLSGSCEDVRGYFRVRYIDEEDDPDNVIVKVYRARDNYQPGDPTYSNTPEFTIVWGPLTDGDRYSFDEPYDYGWRSHSAFKIIARISRHDGDGKYIKDSSNNILYHELSDVANMPAWYSTCYDPPPPPQPPTISGYANHVCTPTPGLLGRVTVAGIDSRSNPADVRVKVVGTVTGQSQSQTEYVDATSISSQQAHSFEFSLGYITAWRTDQTVATVISVRGFDGSYNATNSYHQIDTVELPAYDANNNNVEDCDDNPQPPAISGNLSYVCRAVNPIVGWVEVDGLGGQPGLPLIKIKLRGVVMNGSNQGDSYTVDKDIHLYHNLIVNDQIGLDVAPDDVITDDVGRFVANYASQWQTDGEIRLTLRVLKFNADYTHTSQYVSVDAITLPAYDTNANGSQDCLELPAISGDASINPCQTPIITGWVRLAGFSGATNPELVDIQLIGTIKSGANQGQSHTVELADLTPGSNNRLSFETAYAQQWRSDGQVKVVVKVSEYGRDYQHTGNFVKIDTVTLDAYDADNDGNWDCNPPPPLDKLEITGSAQCVCTGIGSAWLKVDGLKLVNDPTPMIIRFKTDLTEAGQYDQQIELSFDSGQDMLSFSLDYLETWQLSREIDVTISVSEYYEDGSHTGTFKDIKTVTLVAWDADGDGVKDQICRITNTGISEGLPITSLAAVSLGGTAASMVYRRRRNKS